MNNIILNVSVQTSETLNKIIECLKQNEYSASTEIIFALEKIISYNNDEKEIKEYLDRANIDMIFKEYLQDDEDEIVDDLLDYLEDMIYSEIDEKIEDITSYLPISKYNFEVCLKDEVGLKNNIYIYLNETKELITLKYINETDEFELTNYYDLD